MSAITGIIHFNNEPISIEHGTRLMSDLRKYPADDIQIWHKENIFLGVTHSGLHQSQLVNNYPFIIMKNN